MSGAKGWYGADLDGTLAEYEGWKGPEHIGKPVPRMVQTVKSLLARGHEVRIFTARVSQDATGEVSAAIAKWCREHIGQALQVTHKKDYAMIGLYDDRCIQIVPNKGISVAHDIAADLEERVRVLEARAVQADREGNFATAKGFEVAGEALREVIQSIRETRE